MSAWALDKTWSTTRQAGSAICLLLLIAASPILAEVPLPALAVEDARAKLQEGRQIVLNAQVKYAGELLLFDSREAMNLELVYPYCISAGLAPSANHTTAAELDGKRVQVSGTLLRYESPPDGPNEISTFTLIDGMFFKNWCWGSYVLRIEELTVIR